MTKKGLQRYVFALTVVATLFSAAPALAQDKKPKTKQDHDKRLKELQKKEAEQQKEYHQAKHELVEQHMDNQVEGVTNGKEVKKRMKQSKKKAKRNNQNKKEFFLVRMLSNRTKKGKKIKK